MGEDSRGVTEASVHEDRQFTLPEIVGLVSCEAQCGSWKTMGRKEV